jgi:hypothetical protein
MKSKTKGNAEIKNEDSFFETLDTLDFRDDLSYK